jgi:cytochrome c-type biogenesis protein CcmH/NrfG
VTLDPAHPIANAALAEYYFKAPGIAGGSVAKAYEQAERFKKISPLGGADLQASLYLRERKYPELFAALDETLRAHPDHYPALLTFGRAAADSGQHLDRGIASLERSLSLTPAPRTASHATVWYYLGQIRLRKNDTAAARLAYEAALKLDPDHREATAALEKLASPHAIP